MVRPKVRQPWFLRAPEELELLRSTLAARHPTLHADEVQGKIIVQGSFPVAHEGSDLDWYLIDLTLPDDYPESPAIVREIGGRIPREADRHVNVADGSLCLGVAEELWIKSICDFEISKFLDGLVRTFLISNSLVECGEGWPHGERSHGAAGICEFYDETIGIGDPRKVQQLLRYLSKERIKGHWPCPCGSGKKIRNCHFNAVLELHARIPARIIEYSGTIIQTEHGRV